MEIHILIMVLVLVVNFEKHWFTMVYHHLWLMVFASDWGLKSLFTTSPSISWWMFFINGCHGQEMVSVRNDSWLIAAYIGYNGFVTVVAILYFSLVIAGVLTMVGYSYVLILVRMPLIVFANADWLLYVVVYLRRQYQRFWYGIWTFGLVCWKENWQAVQQQQQQQQQIPGNPQQILRVRMEISTVLMPILCNYRPLLSTIHNDYRWSDVHL